MFIKNSHHGKMVEISREKLVNARKALGLTQAQLGDVLGWRGKNRVYRLERGVVPVRVLHLLALEALLRRVDKWNENLYWRI